MERKQVTLAISGGIVRPKTFKDSTCDIIIHDYDIGSPDPKELTEENSYFQDEDGDWYWEYTPTLG